MENLEITKKKIHAWKKIEFEKTLNNLENSWNFVKYFDETTSSQKTSCKTHKTCDS